ncbi:MAG: putative acetyltransferase [Dinoroseobacter sp.]|jgi:putative acetyltransferase
MELRARKPTDDSAIDDLLIAAFAGIEEARLVGLLRDEGAMVTELVAEDDGLVAYAALSRMKAPEGWLALAPEAVLPTRQRTGIAAQIIRALRFDALSPVVVLGKPSYYERFGFSVSSACDLRSAYPLAYTAIYPEDTPVPSGTELIYPRAFQDI